MCWCGRGGASLGGAAGSWIKRFRYAGSDRLGWARGRVRRTLTCCCLRLCVRLLVGYNIEIPLGGRRDLDANGKYDLTMAWQARDDATSYSLACVLRFASGVGVGSGEIGDKRGGDGRISHRGANG
jgi:hypothetical protein